MTYETNTGGRASYVEWSAIIAGAVLASALSLVMVQFGSGVGFAKTIASTHDDFVVSQGHVVAAGCWVLFIQVFASVFGGYVAGRMRAPTADFPTHEREIRDGIHGVLVWATATVAVMVAVSLAGAIAALAPEPAATVKVVVPQDTVNMRENAAIIFAFATAATSLVSGVAAWWAATKGGEHRDKSSDHSYYVSFVRRG